MRSGRCASLARLPRIIHQPRPRNVGSRFQPDRTHTLVSGGPGSRAGSATERARTRRGARAAGAGTVALVPAAAGAAGRGAGRGVLAAPGRAESTGGAAGGGGGADRLAGGARVAQARAGGPCAPGAGRGAVAATGHGRGTADGAGVRAALLHHPAVAAGLPRPD